MATKREDRVAAVRKESIMSSVMDLVLIDRRSSELAISLKTMVVDFEVWMCVGDGGSERG